MGRERRAVHENSVGAAELAELSSLIERLRKLPADDPMRLRAERVAESFSRESRTARSSAIRKAKALTDQRLVTSTALGAETRREDAPVPLATDRAAVGELARPRRCYVCKELYQSADSFYHMLCPACSTDNAGHRSASADLAGRRALVTGGRVKIGFQLALMLLRDGAHVTVTSRFPHDTVRRYLAVPECGRWLDRLTVVGIDLRDPRQVIGLCDRLLAAGDALDILVNNAAQTLRRPVAAYSALAAAEHSALPEGLELPEVSCAPGFRPMPALAPAWPAAELSGRHEPGARTEQVIATVDEAGLLPDPAPANSWSARLGEVDPVELLEAQLVNAVAPALLCDRLLPLLLASPHERRYVVNVSAVEGRFAVRNKTGGHPHTNMAKAALNMLTRTSADELAEKRVYLCSVDTGWITDENPSPKKARIAQSGFRTPLDVVDGAARVYDPIVRGEAGHPVWGVLLKDYREVAW